MHGGHCRPHRTWVQNDLASFFCFPAPGQCSSSGFNKSAVNIAIRYIIYITLFSINSTFSTGNVGLHKIPAAVLNGYNLTSPIIVIKGKYNIIIREWNFMLEKAKNATHWINTGRKTLTIYYLPYYLYLYMSVQDPWLRELSAARCPGIVYSETRSTSHPKWNPMDSVSRHDWNYKITIII